jgi:succinyl-diaminopimelate desuccinylase
MQSPADDWGRFADKYLLARQTAMRELPASGTCGLEVELNMLDSDFLPLETVGTGPAERSFVDALRADFLPRWLAERSQLEVFHWMIEWATRPYFSPQGAVYEGRLLEACLLNALARAGRSFGERLYANQGNLLFPAEVGHDSIPGGWNLAKRRYLERCVDLYGASLATAGIHANLSLPEPLLSWDFVHLPASERGDDHLDDYKNRVYVDGTRRMRAFAAMFIATTASTPMRPERRDGDPVVVLTENDSNRNLTFPSPAALDIADLYRSHSDYLRLTYDLVRRGVRFGNNNWTAVRARSFAEPVERLIAVSAEQLRDLYGRGLYATGESPSIEAVAEQIVIQNLLARIDLPMSRVEVRTDEGGHPVELDIANLALKELLLIWFYARPDYARSFRYDAQDLARVRGNERVAAASGLRSAIEDPLTGKPIGMRHFLGRTLEEIRPLAEALGRWQLLQPLREMAGGGPNTAERLRARIRQAIGRDEIVPADLLKQLAVEREEQVGTEVETISAGLATMEGDRAKLEELLGRARDEARHDRGAPIRFRPGAGALLAVFYPDKTSEIVDLARQLIRIPSVTNAPPGRQRLDEVHRAGTFVFDYLRQAGLSVRSFEQGPYPAVLGGFPGAGNAAILLSGHFDVVEPEPDDTQFEPRVDGDYLWGRGAADMKTVVATYLVWMKDTLRKGGPHPPLDLLLVGNEEIGEGEPSGTPHVLQALREENGYAPHLLIAGERTGEHGDELMGEVCIENRGLVRLEVGARGVREHTGLRATSGDLSAAVLAARDDLQRMFERHLTLASPAGWQSQIRFPFVRIGEAGVFNVTPESGVLGIEIRPVPQDDIQAILAEAQSYCDQAGLSLAVVAAENGIACRLDNPYLQCLLQAVRETFGQEPVLGRKLPGTSARFAPDGQGVVWGQTGIGPHAASERHFLPSVEPYYRALDRLAARARELAPARLPV